MPCIVNLELPRGMRDIEPEEFSSINYIRDKFLDTITLFNFKVVEPSPLEMLSTLEAKGGASIFDEIYSFRDKGNRNIALRFDLTVGLTRFISRRRDLKMPVKLAAFAGVWRYDEPQSARYRYFHQWDVEIYDSFNPESDAEIIQFVSIFLAKLGLNVIIEINDRQLVEEYIKDNLGVSDRNTILAMFRAVDKVPKKGTKSVIDEYENKIDSRLLSRLVDFSNIKGSPEEVYSASDVKYLSNWTKLSRLMDSLKARGVNNARINLGIVRGLDYYSGIVFEASDPTLQLGTLVGGGRYDSLTAVFGRKDMGASGAAGGVERIMIAMKKHGILKEISKPLVYVASTSSAAKYKVLEIVSNLRRDRITADYDIQGRTLRKQIDDAYAKGATIALIIAPEEIDRGQITVRHMKDGSESKQKINELTQIVSEIRLQQ